MILDQAVPFFTPRQLVELARCEKGWTLADWSRNMGVPYRTAQNWIAQGEAAKRLPPDYVCRLLYAWYRLGDILGPVCKGGNLEIGEPTVVGGSDPRRAQSARGTGGGS